MSAPAPSTITSADAQEILLHYPRLLPKLTTPRTTPPLPDLDLLRTTTIPATILTRTPPHLTSPELLSLVHCKLKRGQFRPSLPSLVSSNAATLVVSVTIAAFAHLENGVTIDAVMAGIKDLCKLRGVGPATASYVLAVRGNGKVPVFSDEGYAWVMGTGEGRGKKLKYDEKEYRGYFQAVEKLAGRLGVREEEVERVGWVVGKEAMGVRVEEGGGTTELVKARGTEPVKAKGTELVRSKGAKNGNGGEGRQSAEEDAGDDDDTMGEVGKTTVLKSGLGEDQSAIEEDRPETKQSGSSNRKRKVQDKSKDQPASDTKKTRIVENQSPKSSGNVSGRVLRSRKAPV